LLNQVRLTPGVNDFVTIRDFVGLRWNSVAFALFDSQLDQLRLPVSKPLALNHSFEHDTDQPSPRVERVTIFVERYFEWTAVFSQGNFVVLLVLVSLLFGA
jgi:hypothetical protein